MWISGGEGHGIASSPGSAMRFKKLGRAWRPLQDESEGSFVTTSLILFSIFEKNDVFFNFNNNKHYVKGL